MDLSRDFFAYLCQKYPKLQGVASESLIASQLLSPYSIALSGRLLPEIEATLDAFHSLRGLPAYKDWAQRTWGPIFDPGNYGLFMSYDFHVTPEGGLKLIEINTNASFLALGWEMFAFQGTPWASQFQMSDLLDDLKTEIRLAGQNNLQKVVITDDEPASQKLYIEFLLYQQIFQNWGLDCEIADIRDFSKLKSADLIYNRSTDFYLQEPASRGLQSLLRERQAVVSPHPFEYRLLADKENFAIWSSPQFWAEVPVPSAIQNQILKVLPQSKIMSEENKDQIWSERKQLFFKPKRAYGSKSAYKGASMSRKVFDELIQNNSLAQELIPAPEVEIETPKGSQKFKYDLRCFAYQNRFQGCVARLYQGQVTNLRTEGGGFAPVKIDRNE